MKRSALKATQGINNISSGSIQNDKGNTANTYVWELEVENLTDVWKSWNTYLNLINLLSKEFLFTISITITC